MHESSLVFHALTYIKTASNNTCLNEHSDCYTTDITKNVDEMPDPSARAKALRNITITRCVQFPEYRYLNRHLYTLVSCRKGRTTRAPIPDTSCCLLFSARNCLRFNLVHSCQLLDNLHSVHNIPLISANRAFYPYSESFTYLPSGAAAPHTSFALVPP